MRGLAYRWQVRRARAAAGRPVSDLDVARARARVADSFPEITSEEALGIARRSLVHAAYRRVASGALLRLAPVLLCREVRFDASWASLVDAPAPRCVLLPNLGSPSLARRAAESFLPTGGAGTRYLPLRLDATRPVRFEDPSITPTESIHVLVALLAPQPVARLVVEAAHDGGDLQAAVERLFAQSADHYDWLSG